VSEPEILPSVAVGDNTKMCLTSLILFVAAQKIIERMGNPLLKIRFARQRREIDPSGLGPKVPRLVLCYFSPVDYLSLSGFTALSRPLNASCSEIFPGRLFHYGLSFFAKPDRQSDLTILTFKSPRLHATGLNHILRQ